MGSRIIFFLFFLILSIKLYSQQIITLDATNSDQSNIYEARDAVIYKPGYHYKPSSSSDFMIGRINESIICDVDYTDINDIVGVDEDISKKLAVGQISGTYGVSSTGSATYTIPIFTPKGVNSLHPNISLVYNSSSKYGIAGAGWNISGISAISRSNKDFYHDGKVESFNLNTVVGFNFNGNRLILKPNQNGSGITQYKYFLENENFSEIIYNTNENYFTIKAINGMLYEYGKNTDSRFRLNNDDNKTINWYLNKVTDVFGNEIIYKYKNEDNEVVLESIEYAGVNKIKFLYQDRTVDNIKGYIKGYIVEKKKLLRKIKVYTNNVVIREYELKYTHSNNLTTQLYEIIEKGIDAEQLNSLIFDYENEIYKLSPSQNYLLGINPQTSDYLVGDFNGDGLSDLLEFRYNKEEYTNYGYTSYTKVQDGALLRINDNGLLSTPTEVLSDVDYNLYSTLPDPRFENTVLMATKTTNLYKFDINSDGKEDLLLKKNKNAGTITYTPYISTGFGFIEKSDDSFDVDITYGDDLLTFGDFNGDGNIDAYSLQHWGASNDYMYSFITLNGSYSYEHHPLINGSFVNFIKKILPIDFDGDGSNEIMTIDNSRMMVWDCIYQEGIGYRFSSQPIFQKYISDCFYDYGDFNSDGISDIIKVNNNKLYYCIGNGNGYSDFIEVTGVMIANFSNDRNNIYIFDYNNDGKSDIIIYDDIYCNILIANGDGFNDPILLSLTTYNNESNVYVKHYICGIGDINGNGNTNLFFQSEFNHEEEVNMDNHKFYSVSFIEGEKPNLLKKVRNSFGNITEFQYSNLTNNNIYTKGTGATFPVMDYQGAIPVVSYVISEDGIGGTITTNYKYEGAKIHLQGRGFLGFSKIITESEDLNIKNIKTFNFNDYYFVSNYYKEETKTYDDIPISFTESYFELNHDLDIDAGTNLYIDKYKRFKSKITSSTSKNYLKNITSNTSYEYYPDDYSNIKKVTQNINNGEYISFKELEYVDNFFFVDNVPALIKKQTETIIKQGETPFTTEVNYTYNNGIPSTKESLGITTHYENYDNFGNPTKIRTSVNDPLIADRSETFTFDNTGRFITSRTNTLNQTIEYEYNTIWGKVKKTTDINELETTYEYDNWGRLKKTILPNGLITTNSINWLASEDSEMPTALYYTLTETTDMPYKKTYFDSFGRKLRVETKSFGNKIFADIRYDKYGHKIETYDTYFDGDFSSAELTTNEYDNFSRISKTTYKNIETDFSYNIVSGKYTETTNFDVTGTAKIYKSFYDAIGNITKSQSPNGTVENTFASNGQAIDILAQNVGTSMQYDETTAQQTSLTDPNSGITSYEYNQFGELIKQTDANNKVQEIIIDEHGRTDYTTNDEGTTDIEYVENGNGLGQIKSVEAPNGNKTENTYDEFGRTTQTIETIDGQNYNHGFEYDQYGKLVKETYPSGFAVKYIYNNQGELLSVEQADNNHSIWYCNDYNEKGQPNKIYLGANGSNLKTTYQYNGFSRITNIKTGFDFDINYEWNNTTGNLLNRTNGDNIEVFTYDLLDRLKTWEVNGSLFTMQYTSNGNGNISYKPQVGTYTYDPSKVHAITQIHNPTSAISLQQQDISYTSFNKANTITEGNYQLQIEYGAENYRKKTILQENGTTINTRIFVGNYEKEILQDGTVKEYHYISGPTGLIAIYIITNGTGHLYYTATDHLGSICQILETNGSVVEETNYDPWGRVRDANTWEYPSESVAQSHALTKTIRGYTGHEHLPQFALINMNGRMYDPVLGRMLSPDNFVQDPSNAQNYNRYAYVLNNPLKYVDLNGENFSDFTGFVIGGIIGIVTIPLFPTGFTVKYWSAYINEINGNGEMWKGVGNGFADGGKAIANFGIIASQIALITWDNKENFWYNLGTIGSKLTYQLPLQIAGSATGIVLNAIGQVDDVDIAHGDIIIQTSNKKLKYGMAFSNYLFGDFSDRISGEKEGFAYYSSETYGIAKGFSLLGRNNIVKYMGLMNKKKRGRSIDKAMSLSFDYYDNHKLGKKPGELTIDQINFMIQNNISLNQDFINWHYIWDYENQ